MLFKALVDTSAALAATTRRLRKTAIAAELLHGLDGDSARVVTSYLIGELPQGRIGVGSAAVRRLSAEPAAKAKLTLADVDHCLDDIAAQQGKGSQTRREQLMNALFGRATANEQDFLTRLLLGELRQGALDGVLTEAVARAAGLDAVPVRRALMFSGSLPEVAACALRDGAAGLAGFSLELFRPLQPMLAQPIETPAGALRAGDATAFEYKLDGARVQVHRSGDTVRVYSRQLNDVTDSVPEVVDAALALPTQTFVFDGEALALDRDARPLPFQVTMQRFGRRLDVDVMRERIPLSVRLFDCLRLDDRDLIDEPYQERVAVLDAIVPAALRVPRLVTADAGQAAGFVRDAIAAGHEGVMAKALASTYQAGSRGADWHKIKPVHTLDLVVIAAEWGSGRRRGRLSNLHLGARDADSGEFVMLGKTFKGLTDKLLAWQTQQLLAREIGRNDNVVYVRPELVVEIAFNELQRSRQYPAGLALRFARVRRYRDDKTAVEADTLDTVQRIHEAGLQGLLA